MTITEQQHSIQSQDGWSLNARLFKPEDPKATVVMLPAMGASLNSYRPMAEDMAERGLCVLLGDPRGIGQSGPLPSRQVDFSMHDHIDYDWPAFIDHARQHGAGPLFVGGHSLGGKLSALYCALHDQPRVDGFFTLASCAHWYRYWQLYQRPFTLSVYWAFAALTHIFGFLPGDKVGWGKPCAATVTREWSRWGRSGQYTTRSGQSMEDQFKTYTGKALIISFADDVNYAPKRAVDALAERFSNAQLTRQHLSPEDLNCQKLGHFDWRKQPQAWAHLSQQLLKWV